MKRCLLGRRCPPRQAASTAASSHAATALQWQGPTRRWGHGTSLAGPSIGGGDGGPGCRWDRPPGSRGRRSFSSLGLAVPTVLDADALRQRLVELGPSMARSLNEDGYWTNFRPGRRGGDGDDGGGDDGDEVVEVLVPLPAVRAMRDQCLALRAEGRFEQSWSERMVDGRPVRFDKDGVFACEPDGKDYETAPDMLLYMSALISTLPAVLNEACRYDRRRHRQHRPLHAGSGDDDVVVDNDGPSLPSDADPPLDLSDQAFNAKLAVTSPGGSTYPLHVDNTAGVTGSRGDDTRKLTCILYLNPDHDATGDDGGELRLHLLGRRCLDLPPSGGRVVAFWSDEIPHEVLPCKPGSADPAFDRYALTVWIPDRDPRNVCSDRSPFAPLRRDAFSGESWC